MVYQYYVIEITRNANGELAHNVYWAWDENQDTARLKGESKYYEVLSDAAISEYAEHSVILISSDCYPIYNKSYTHATDTTSTTASTEE